MGVGNRGSAGQDLRKVGFHMLQSKAEKPGVLALLGAVAVQIVFAIYGPGFSIWALLQAPNYGYQGVWLLVIGVIAVLDLALLGVVAFHIIRVMLTGTGWKHMWSEPLAPDSGLSHNLRCPIV